MSDESTAVMLTCFWIRICSKEYIVQRWVPNQASCGRGKGLYAAGLGI